MKILDLIELTPPIRKFELKESEEKELKKNYNETGRIVALDQLVRNELFSCEKKVCPSPLGPN